MTQMQKAIRCVVFARLAHLAAVCFAGLAILFLNLPEIGRSAALTVAQNINLSGNGITIDSYNSSDPSKSTGGQWDPAKAGDAGDVICIGSITNSVSVGNANIFGRLYTGSGTGVSLGANGAVGTHTWLAAGNYGIEPGYWVPNTNFPFPNISLPDYSGFLGPVIPGGTVVTTNSGVPVTNSYDNIICGNCFATNGLGNAVVTCPSTLVLPNGYEIGSLTILPGASLTVFAGGSSIAVSGNNILNQGNLPSALVIYCTSDVTSLAVSGNTPFTGVLIAPNANVSLAGGGEYGINMSGAIVVKSLNVSGQVNLHFDEALTQQGIVPPYPSFAASLSAPTMTGGGQFQFNVTGVVGFNYVFETSTDLADWSPVFTNSLPCTFTDTNSSGLSRNFYRVVYTQ